jgi:hypothetical protein
MYAVVRIYQNEAPDGVQLAVELQNSVKQVLTSVRGLVAYYAIDKGDGSLATISVYDDKSSAEESNRVGAREHGQMVTQSTYIDPGRSSDPRALTITRAEVRVAQCPAGGVSGPKRVLSAAVKRGR